MKILHLLYESKGDYFGIGGVGIRAYKIYNYLKDKHDVTLLCKKYPAAQDGYRDGLKHIFVGTESRNFTKTLLSYAYQAALFVKKHGDEFDIIIEEFSPAIPTFLHLYKKRPVVLQIQGYTGRQYFRKYNLFYSTTLYILEKLRPKYYKDIIVVSDVTKSRLNLDNKKNIFTISNGVDGELLELKPGESDYILYLGRIDIHHKGLDILLDAYKEFYGKFPEVRLVIAGEGRDMGRFIELVDKLQGNIKKNIEIIGWIDGERKLSLLKNALIVVIPSRYESQAIVALEAMACGKAIIVSDIPELNYVVANSAGISFKTENAVSLAKSMKEIISSKEYKDIGRRGRDWVKEFTWDKIARSYEEFLYKVFKSKINQ